MISLQKRKRVMIGLTIASVFVLSLLVVPMPFVAFGAKVGASTNSRSQTSRAPYHQRKADTFLLNEPKTVMVQMFEWPWKDVARECENVLGPMNIAAIQVSPPQEHLVFGGNQWWERYQPVSFKLETRAGSELEFVDMVQRCKKSGVDVYVDVILNHMAGIREGHGFAGTHYTKYNHLGLFSPQDFHFCGRYDDNQIRNYKDRYELQFCELLGLADLKTESPYVRQTLTGFLNYLVNLGVAGFRVDAAKHIPASDLSAILSSVRGAPYFVSETLVGPGDPVSIDEYIDFTDVHYFPYAYDLARMIRGGYIAAAPNVIATGYPASDRAVIFVENHDTERENPIKGLTRAADNQLYEMGEVFLLTWPYGYPQIYSGYRFKNYDDGPPVDSQGRTLPVLDAEGRCQAPWSCEHRLPYLRELVHFRNATNNAFYASKQWSSNQDIFAFSRGPLGFVFINTRWGNFEGKVPTDLPDGDYCNLMTKQNGQCQHWYTVTQGQVSIKSTAHTAIVLLHSERR